MRRGWIVAAPLYESLRTRLTLEGIDVIDLAQCFVQRAGDQPLDQLFIGHYSPRANEIVAGWLHEELAGRGLTGSGRAGRDSIAS